APVDWSPLLTNRPGTHTDLPTYAFQRQRYWLDTRAYLADSWLGGSADVREAGLTAFEHPMLGAALRSPEGERITFTGRLSAESTPWLLDHAVGGIPLLPGTGFVELVLAAGAHVGCGALEELTLEAPLVLPERGGMSVQVVIGEDSGGNGRPVTVYSCHEASEGPWTRHASGALLAGDGVTKSVSLGEWPPRGAEVLPVEGLYGELAEAGFGYGPVFQGLRAAWRRGEELFAEVALPDGADDGAAYGLHPALFDACLHLIGLVSDGGPARVPFAWSDVALHAWGASAVRVRVSPDAGSDAMTLEISDTSGTPVASVGSLVLREPAAVRQPTRNGLYHVVWTPVSAGRDASVADFTTLRLEPARDAAAVHAAVQRALAEVQSALASGTRLAFVTCGAVALPGEDVTDLAGAAVWGLVRSAQAEHPGAFLLVDTDRAGDTDVHAAAAAGEPQILARAGQLFAPRLQHVVPSDEHHVQTQEFGPDGVVLVTGAGGALGGVVARHLVSAHGVRR
ncbi:polyketide synthase dehydratase domain-containing protein, partial [Streptomyces sp. NPDC054786]